MELYCQVYIDAVEPTVVADRLAAALGGRASGRTVVARDVELDVMRNDKDRPDPPRSFLDYPLYVDIFPAEDAGDDESGFVSAVARVLDALAAEGIEHVAACEFEDRLPGSGRSPGALP